MTLSNSKLIAYEATDSLLMKGFLATSRENLATIIHIHGNCGNFYENPFIPVMAETYATNGLNFLSVNNRGHDGLAEAYRNGKLVYVGGSFESLEECIYDIEGAIQFAQKLGAPVILQGHSFGCLKVLVYLANRQAVDFVLLSPADTHQLHCNYIHPQRIEEQIKRIEREYATNLDAILPAKEFGIGQESVQYHIPMSASALIRLLRSPNLGLLRYKQPKEYFIDSSAFIYYGGSDGLWTEPNRTVEGFFKKRVRDLRFFFLEQGDHQFHGFEALVAEEIAKWAKDGSRVRG